MRDAKQLYGMWEEGSVYKSKMMGSYPVTFPWDENDDLDIGRPREDV